MSFVQTAHLPGILVRKATYLAKYGTVVGCAAIVVALLLAMGATVFWRRTETLISMVMAWLTFLLALGCFVTGSLLLRFGYRWSLLKETIAGEVIHALKSDRGLPATGSPTSYQPQMAFSGNHRDVNVTVSPLALRVDERVSSWKALRDKRQRYKQLKQEADARGPMEAPQVGFKKVKCPHCALRFEIAEKTEHKERRCPRCLTFVVPVPPYPLDEFLGHTFYDDVCTKCGCGTSFVKAFGTKCSPD